MVAHGGRDGIDVLVVGMDVVARDRLLRERELVAPDELQAARARLDGEHVLDRLHIEVHVEVRRVVDARRDVAHRVPIDERPLERHIRAFRRVGRQRHGPFVPHVAFRRPFDDAVLVPVRAAMLVRVAGRWSVEEGRREADANRLRPARRLHVGVRGDAAGANVPVAALEPRDRGVGRGRGWWRRCRAGGGREQGSRQRRHESILHRNVSPGLAQAKSGSRILIALGRDPEALFPRAAGRNALQVLVDALVRQVQRIGDARPSARRR